MIEILGYWLAGGLVRWLPAPLIDRIGIAAARFTFALRPPARRALEANLARLLGAGSVARVPGVARESFEHFALSFADFLRLEGSDPGLERDLVVHGREHLTAARASGRGVILVSAHLGSWERGAAWIAANGPRLHVVARPHGSPWVERFFQRRRGAWGVRRLPGRPLWREAARALRRHEWVALMADRDAPGTRGSACAWAAALSRRTGALVLPAIMVRLPDRRYATFIEPPLAPDQVRSFALRDTLRRYLVRYPGQWFAFEPLPEGLA